MSWMHIFSGAGISELNLWVVLSFVFFLLSVIGVSLFDIFVSRSLPAWLVMIPIAAACLFRALGETGGWIASLCAAVAGLTFIWTDENTALRILIEILFSLAAIFLGYPFLALGWIFFFIFHELHWWGAADVLLALAIFTVYPNLLMVFCLPVGIGVLAQIKLLIRYRKNVFRVLGERWKRWILQGEGARSEELAASEDYALPGLALGIILYCALIFLLVARMG